MTDHAKKKAPRPADLLLALAVLGAAVALAYGSSLELGRRSQQAELVEAATVLEASLLAYHLEHAAFPPSARPAEDAFRGDTLEPLVREGLLPDPDFVTSRLAHGRVTAYDSPDRPTTNSDFWAVLVHAEDPTLQCLVADTDEYPGRLGTRLRGVYLIGGTNLKKVSR